ncbi:MAG TPA: PAS domain S-box protein, partial [bacterium]|nr:PAS domain S-box protein [bacterium]
MADTDRRQSGIEGDHSFRTIVHRAREFILKLDREGRILFANQYAVETSGRDASRWIGRSFESVIHRDDLPFVKHLMKQVKNGKSVSSEIRIMGRRNQILWLYAEALPIHHNNTLKYILCFARDITHQKRMENALRDSEKQYREINALLEGTFNSIPDVLGIQDLNHAIIRYNAAGYRFLGITPEQAIGKKCFELIGRKIPCEVCATTQCYRTKTAEQLEKYIPEMDIWLDVRAYPILDDSGNLE